MIAINCNDLFLYKEIYNLLSQKNIILSPQRAEFFSRMDIIQNDKNISIKLNEDSLVFNKPIIFNSFFKSFYKMISNTHITFKDCNYFPYKCKIIFRDKTTILGNKHNLIFTNLFLNSSEGINKINLYKIVWPEDKTTQINKLDTHLTNLKSQILKDLDILLEFTSTKGLIKLRIN